MKKKTSRSELCVFLSVGRKSVVFLNTIILFYVLQTFFMFSNNSTLPTPHTFFRALLFTTPWVGWGCLLQLDPNTPSRYLLLRKRVLGRHTGTLHVQDFSCLSAQGSCSPPSFPCLVCKLPRCFSEIPTVPRMKTHFCSV